MSKKDITARQYTILKKLYRGSATLKEINQYLEIEGEIQGYNLKVSERTFQRDRADILSLFNISIECNKRTNSYYISDSADSALHKRLLDAYSTQHAINSSLGISEYLDLEKYSSSGTENLYGILHAVKNRLELNITYQSYYDDTPTPRSLLPYFLKEFKNRWYLIALDSNKNSLRTYALDRIKNISISKKTFGIANKDLAKSHFKDCFGIVAPENSDPLEPVVLSFTTFQGKFVKSLPLHHSQEVIEDSEERLIVQLNVYPTFDLAMQILSYGENVEVLAPNSLRNGIRESLRQALGKYE
jgi:predicted DNA-binding transcriptional regulator YafY